MDQAVAPKKFYKKWWFWVGVVVLSFVVGISVDESPMVATPQAPTANAVEATPAPEAIKVTAVQMSADYKENEVAADAKYKNKTVEISGSVDTIGKDILDTPYIAFQTASQYDILDRVQCMFSKSDEAELAAVTKGQKITLRGEVSGKLGNIIVKGCEIVR